LTLSRPFFALGVFCVKVQKSSINTTNTTNTGAAREISLLTPQIQTTWQSALHSELAPENAQILAEMIIAGETHLPVIQGMLYLLAQRASDNPLETQFALLVGILTGKTSLDWEAGSAAPVAAPPSPVSSAANPTNTRAADEVAPPSPAAALSAGGDPVLAQVTQWYEQEIETLSAFSADELRDLTGRFRDLQAWKEAFTKAAAAKKGIARWAYIVKCMEGSDGKFRLDRKPKKPSTEGDGGNGGGDRAASSRAPADDRRRGNRSRPRVTQSTAEEHAAAEVANHDPERSSRLAALKERLATETQRGRGGGNGQ